MGGIGLGPMGGLGLLVFVFLFRLPPGSPPGNVLGMILAVITALSLMQAAGGLDYVIQLAEKVLRRNPRRITILAPLVTYLLILASGTQHVIYALLPVIAEVARKAGIRPERPLSMSVIASQHGLVASPVSAATVALIGGIDGVGCGIAANHDDHNPGHPSRRDRRDFLGCLPGTGTGGGSRIPEAAR